MTTADNRSGYSDGFQALMLWDALADLRDRPAGAAAEAAFPGGRVQVWDGLEQLAEHLQLSFGQAARMQVALWRADTG